MSVIIYLFENTCSYFTFDPNHSLFHWLTFFIPSTLLQHSYLALGLLTPLMKVGLSFMPKFQSMISPPLEPTARVLG